MPDALQLQITADSTDAVGQIHLVVDNTKELESALSGAGAAGLEAGDEISEGMEKAGYSVAEARHATHLLGEEMGVRVPRALQSVIASSETLGPILASAFSAVALVGFIELADRFAEKISSWIADTFIYTDAEKELNKEILESNKQMAEYAAKTEQLGRAYELIGKTGSEATDIKIGFSTDDILQTEAAMRNLQDQMYKMRNEGDAAGPDYGKMADQLGVLQAKLKEQQQESQNLVKEFTQQQEKEAIDANNKRYELELKMDEAIGRSRQQLAKELEETDKEEGKITDERLAAQEKAEEKASNAAIEQQERQLKGYMAMEQGEAKAIEQADSSKEKAIQREFAQRKISGDQYLASLSELYNSEVNALMNALNQEEELYVTTAQLEASKRGEILSEEEVKESSGFQELENKKLAIQQQFIDKYSAAELKQVADEQKVIDGSLNKINTEFASTFANIEMGHETLGKGALKMWQSMETAALQSLAKIALAEIEGMLLHRTNAEMQRLDDAKSAAAGAYKGVMESAIPFPFNMALAAGAGAGAFATVMAFDEGGMVPSDQMAMVHAGEGVLTPPQVENLRQVADNGGGGDTHNYGDTHIHANDAASFESYLKKNPGALSAGIKHAVRNGHLSPSDLARGK